MHDIIIVGGGPAGLTAAVYALRAGKTVLVIEKNGFGGQIAFSPKVENIPGTKLISGTEFADQLTDQAMALGADVELENVVSVEDLGDYKRITTEEGSAYEGKAVVLAVGVKHRMLGLPGEHDLVGKGLSFCAVCDGAFYAGQDTVMIGGGNSALEETLYLSRIVNKVYLVHRRDAFRGAKIYEDKIRETSNIELVTKSVIDEIRGGNAGMDSVIVRNVENGDIRIIEAEGLFVYVGMAPVSSFLPASVERDAAGFIVTDAEMCTSAPGIFAAGDVRAKRCRQVSSAVGDGATAATAALTYLEHWNA